MKNLYSEKKRITLFTENEKRFLFENLKKR